MGLLNKMNNHLEQTVFKRVLLDDFSSVERSRTHNSHNTEILGD